MLRFLALLTLVIFSVGSPSLLASYQMFCELEGEIVSTPVLSEFIEFEFQVELASNLEVELLGSGEPDCHLMQGKRIKVILEPENAGDQTEIVAGARLTLQRYEIDVIREQTGDVVRSIKHVRTGN